MVWLAGDDLVRAVELLEQDNARELVRQRHLAEREAHVAAVEVESARPADDEAEVAAGHAPLLEEVAEADRVELTPVPRQQDDEGALRDAAVDALVLAHLDQLEACVAGEHLLVVLDVVRVWGAEASDGYEEGSHGVDRLAMPPAGTLSGQAALRQCELMVSCPGERVANPVDRGRVGAEDELEPCRRVGVAEVLEGQLALDRD